MPFNKGTLDAYRTIACRDLEVVTGSQGHSGSASISGSLTVYGTISGSDYQGLELETVTKIAASGSTLLSGNIYLTGSPTILVSETGQIISISGSTSPTLINLTATNVTGSTLVSGSKILGATATITYISGSLVSGSNIYGSYISGSQFSGSLIYGQYITGSLQISGSSIYGNYITGSQVSISGTAYVQNLSGSGNISGSTFQGTVLTGFANSGSTLLVGNVYLTGSGAVSLTQTGQAIYISGSTGTGSGVGTGTGSLGPYSYIVYSGSASGGPYFAEDDKGSVVYSGSNATTVIQTSINNLTNGGMIFIRAGSYEIKESIDVKDNITIAGEGDGTRLYVPDYQTTFKHLFINSGSQRYNIHIKNLFLDGNMSKMYPPMEKVFFYNGNTTVWTDETSDLNNATVNDVLLPPVQVSTVGDAIYIGKSDIFNRVWFTVGTAGVYSGITLAWQYWTGSWVTLNQDDYTYKFTAAGTDLLIGYGTLGTVTGWDKTTVNGYEAYWIRCIVTGFSTPSITTTPSGSFAKFCSEVTGIQNYGGKHHIEGVHFKGLNGCGVNPAWVDDLWVNNCIFEDCSVGFYDDIGCERVRVTNNLFSGSHSAGIEIVHFDIEGNPAGWSNYSNNIIYNTTNGYGILAYVSQHIIIDNNIIFNNNGVGIGTDGLYKSIISNNLIHNNLGLGISLSKTEDSSIVDNIVFNTTSGYAQDVGIRDNFNSGVGGRNTIRGNKIFGHAHTQIRIWVPQDIIESNEVSGSTGIDFYSSTGSYETWIRGNKINNCVIGIDVSTDNNYIVENFFENNTTNITNTGTGNVFKRNIGYVTENGGIATISAQSGSVAHGLSASGSNVTLTASGSASNLYMGALSWYPSGSAGFWIVQTGSGTVAVNWKAEV